MAPDPRSERAGVRGVSRPALEGLLIRMLGGRLAPRRSSFVFQQCRQEVPARILQVFRPQHHQCVWQTSRSIGDYSSGTDCYISKKKKERRKKKRETRTRLWILPLFQEPISDGTQKIPQSLLWMIPLSVLYITKTASTC